MSLYVSLFIFLAATCAVLGLASLGYDLFLRRRSEVRSRLDAEFHGQRTATGTESALFRNLSSAAERKDGGERRLHRALETFLEQAGLEIRPESLLTRVFGCALAVGAVAGTLTGQWGTGAGAFLLVAGAPLAYVALRRQRRIEKLRRQLPDAFELMSRTVKAGQTLSRAFQLVAQDLENPVADEFGLCHEQQTLGIPAGDALRDLARRNGVMELQMFVVAVLVQRQSGGNPVRLLDNLAEVIRKRVKLKAKVGALTGEGRMQALVLMLLPPAVFAALWMLNRNYATALVERPELLYGALASEFVGALWIRRIVNFSF